jgi:ribonuclease P protein subunit POP4
MMTPENLIKHELIGLKVKVVSSTNQSQIGLEGEVSDESRNTLTIETSSGSRSIPKDQATFEFILPSGESVRVDGKLLVARPEDRVKKSLKKW